MSATNIARAGLIAKLVELESVTLRDAQVSSRISPLDVPVEFSLLQEYRAWYERAGAEPDHLFVYVELKCTAADAEGDGAALDLTATYLLLYTLSESEDLPEDALQFFAELNGVYNVWPYWRELVQTVSGRVGLTSIVVPVFRPPVRKIEPTEPQGTPPKPPRKRASAAKAEP